MWVQISENLQIEKSNPLGKGGFSTVYKGVYSNSQEVAVKELKRIQNNGSVNGYFEAEIELSEKLKSLQNPYLVYIYEIIQPFTSNQQNQQGQQSQQQSAFIVMELCTGDLKKLLKGKPSEDFLKSFCIIRAIAEGVKQLHDLNIVHRDLKPDNVFTTRSPDGNQIYYKVGDFGLGKDDQLDMQTQIGTISYMAPEMLGTSPARYNKKVDIWALGVMAHEILTGVNIFNGNSLNQIRNIIVQFKSYNAMRQEMSQRINVSRDLIGESFRRINRQEVANLLDAMLQPNPDLRYDINRVCDLLGQIMDALANNQLDPVEPESSLPEQNRIPRGLRVTNHEKKLSSSQNTFLAEQQVAELKGKNAQLQAFLAELTDRSQQEQRKAAKDKEETENEIISLKNKLFSQENQRKVFEDNFKAEQTKNKKLTETNQQLLINQKSAESKNNELNGFIFNFKKEIKYLEQQNNALQQELIFQQQQAESQKAQSFSSRQSMDNRQMPSKSMEEQLKKENQWLRQENEMLNRQFAEQIQNESPIYHFKKCWQSILKIVCPSRNSDNHSDRKRY